MLVYTTDSYNINVISLKTGMKMLPKITMGKIGMLAVHPEQEILYALVKDNKGWVV